MDKKPMSNFVNPRIKFNKAVKPGTAAMFSAVGDKDATVNVSFDAATGSVALDANSATVSVNKSKATIGFDLTTSNLPGGASVQIVGVEFSKPNEPSGTFDASGVFEDQSTFTDGSGAAHTVYGQWKNGQTELQVIDDNNVPAGGTQQDYGYKVWVKLTPANGSPSYYASPDPEVKNEPTT
jgi:hypothetical protein